jgi:hypothetical protein
MTLRYSKCHSVERHCAEGRSAILWDFKNTSSLISGFHHWNNFELPTPWLLRQLWLFRLLWQLRQLLSAWVA